VNERCVAVAYSGGRDSTALLHATLHAAAAQGVRVIALHVHHGLSPHADAWLAHCAATCRRWAGRGAALGFATTRLETKPARGASIEAWARRERYAALASLAREHGASLVLLAQHRRDQAETVVLQALRGAGPAGLAAMPREFERDGLRWGRPWLDASREAIDAYLRRFRLRFIDDDSNADPRFARNRLRLEVWPALVGAFPQAEATLATSASLAAEATQALAELADLDLRAVLASDGAIDLAPWRDLSPARRANLLRAWLAQCTGASPPAALIARLLREADAPGAARWPIERGELRRHRARLCFVPSSPTPGASDVAAPLDLARAGAHRLPGWPGVLEVTTADRQGLAASCLSQARIAPRSGGERFQLGVGRPARRLKKQYQALGIAPWQRDGPLLWCGGRLLFVAGLGIDARAFARPGEPQFALRWLPDAGSH
jgi:tRNA(Ile)-lysidine synthase